MPPCLPRCLPPLLLLLLQGTFTDDAVIITMGVYCGDFEGGDHRRSFLSVVYAFSKTALYTRPPEDGCNIYAATYFPATSWYRSVPPSGQALVESKYKPFNNYVQPARPQDVEDVDKPPMLVMKVGCGHPANHEACVWKHASLNPQLPGATLLELAQNAVKRRAARG